MSELVDKWRSQAPHPPDDPDELAGYFYRVLEDARILSPQTALGADRDAAFLHDLTHFTRMIAYSAEGLAPQVPAYGPHWLYVTRAKHVAEAMGDTRIAKAFAQMETRLRALPTDQIDAVLENGTAEGLTADREAEIRKLLTGDELLRDAIIASFPKTDTYDAHLVRFVEMLREGASLSAQPLDPDLEDWLIHQRDAKQSARDRVQVFLDRGHERHFVEFFPFDPFPLEALESAGAFLQISHSMGFAGPAAKLGASLLTSTDGRLFCMLRLQDGDCVMDLQTRRILAQQPTQDLRPEHWWSLSGLPALHIDIPKRAVSPPACCRLPETASPLPPSKGDLHAQTLSTDATFSCRHDRRRLSRIETLCAGGGPR